MADCEEIVAGHAQRKGKGRERNWKDEEIEMLITLYEERPCLWDVGHKDYMNRDSKEVAYSQIDLLMSDEYDIGRVDYKSSSSQAISIWAFLSDSFTFVVQTSYYHTQSSYFFGFLLVERHVLIHLHALRVALGTRKCKHLSPDFFGSQFIIKRMRSSFVFGNNVSSFGTFKAAAH